MKKITLTQGLFVLVDENDYAIVNSHHWYLIQEKHTCYAHASIKINGKWKMVLMHRLIMKAEMGTEIDHVDGDGLNNQKENLRFCTHAQNCLNRRPRIGTSGFKGVSFHKKSGKWRAMICPPKTSQSKHIGCFKVEYDAALAYDKKAKELFGEFAYLNFPEKRLQCG